jgi:hypothetical protein
MENTDQIRADRQLIEDLGGPTKTAELLGYDKAKGGVQRVQNWMTRGIPARVRIAHPTLFMPRVVAPCAPSRLPPSLQDKA